MKFKFGNEDRSVVAGKFGVLSCGFSVSFIKEFINRFRRKFKGH